MIFGVYIRTNNLAMIIQKIKYGTQKRHFPQGENLDF